MKHRGGPHRPFPTPIAPPPCQTMGIHTIPYAAPHHESTTPPSPLSAPTLGPANTFTPTTAFTPSRKSTRPAHHHPSRPPRQSCPPNPRMGIRRLDARLCRNSRLIQCSCQRIALCMHCRQQFEYLLPAPRRAAKSAAVRPPSYATLGSAPSPKANAQPPRSPWQRKSSAASSPDQGSPGSRRHPAPGSLE